MYVKIAISPDHIIEGSVPQSWNELSLRQQLLCYGILLTDANEMFEPGELLPGKKIMLLQALLNMTEQDFAAWEKGCIRDAAGDEQQGRLIFLSQLSEAAKCADFLFEKIENGYYQIALKLTRCPLPVLSRTNKLTKKPVNYYPPADRLANITIYEMARVFTLFEDIQIRKKFHLVDELIATIYRPKKPATPENKRSGYNGDIRLPYLNHEATVEKRTQHMKMLPFNVKQLLLFWVASCRQAIVEAYPNVFSGEGEGSDGRKYGWSGVLLSLSDGLVHLDAVARQNHGNALTYLSYLEDQRRKQQLQAL